MVTLLGASLFLGDHASTLFNLRGLAQKNPNLGEHLFMTTPFDLERPNSAWYRPRGEYLCFWDQQPSQPQERGPSAPKFSETTYLQQYSFT